MSQLSGRTFTTTITKLDITSADNTKVLMIQRDSMGGVSFRIRMSHQSSWDSSDEPRYEVSKDDARLLGILMKGEDASYSRPKLDEITYSEFKTPAPETHTEEEIRADCTQLDIERAKAANLAEERELLRLTNERDHALDKHFDQQVDGCDACDRRIRPGYGDGVASYLTTVYHDGRPTSEPYDSKPDIDAVEDAVDAADLGEDLPF